MIDGLEADVVTLALADDIDAIWPARRPRRRGLAERLPNNSAPYTSTIVFLVRKGNPKGIHDWDDLVKPGVRGHHAEPEDLRRPLWYLAAWGYALDRTANRRRQRASSCSGSSRTCRCSTPAPAARRRPSRSAGIGDVLIAWENEAFLIGAGARRRTVRDRLPLAHHPGEPPVAVVENVVDRRGTRKVARPTCASSTRPRPGDHRPPLLPAARRGGAEGHGDRFPADAAPSPSTSGSAAGPRRRPSTSPTAASSTRSSSRR